MRMPGGISANVDTAVPVVVMVPDPHCKKKSAADGAPDELYAHPPLIQLCRPEPLRS